MRRINNKGFTLIELVLVITILGILAVMALPNFIDITTDAQNSARSGVVGAVRAGINIELAERIVADPTDNAYTATLGGADGAASGANPLFTTVLQQGVTDGDWSQAGLVYTYAGGDAACVYTYVPADGSFESPDAGCP